jgi:Fe-S oxidoreductase
VVALKEGRARDDNCDRGRSPQAKELLNMATIRATCTVCGDVELGTAEVRVRVDPSSHQGTYAFVCPRCDTLVVKPAQSRTIDLLLASGVEYEVAPQDAPHGDPIDEVEIDAFSELLGDDARLWEAFEASDSRR